jgi:predicted transposase/invertase (TIGR01784 family)
VYTDGEISFSFTLIKLWQLDPAGILQKDQIQLLPFVPLMKNGVNYVDNIEKRIYTDSIELSLKSDLLTALTFFAGMRDQSVATTLLKRRRDLMIESPVYDMIKEEGLEQGIEQGIEQGLQEVEKREKQAEKRKALDTARRMKEEGLPNDLISRVTGLSVEEIEQL